MIRVEPTTDESYILSVFLNPKVYAEMRDDSCPAQPGALHNRDIKSIPGFFLRVFVGETPAGVFWLVWKNAALEAHTALLENCRGRDAIRAARLAMRYVFSNTNVPAVSSYAWSDAPQVQWFCRAVGMRETGRISHPHTRSGHPVSVINYAISRQEFKI